GRLNQSCSEATSTIRRSPCGRDQIASPKAMPSTSRVVLPHSTSPFSRGWGKSTFAHGHGARPPHLRAHEYRPNRATVLEYRVEQRVTMLGVRLGAVRGRESPLFSTLPRIPRRSTA